MTENDRFRRRKPGELDAAHERRDRENLIAELTRIRRRLNTVTARGKASFYDEDDETGYLAVQAILINFDDAATRRIPAEVKQKLPDIPWDSISGMRNLLAHDYQSAQKRLIWRVATKELADLLDALLADGVL